MKGIILAAGKGTRLYPITKVISKQLLPVYDKPMIYYPLSVLMLAKIRDILIITTPEDLLLFQKLLGNGSGLGLHIQYKVQEKPNGIAEALIIGEHFLNGDSFALVLGDNLFYGQGLTKMLLSAKKNTGATIFGYRVKDAKRYGVVTLNEENIPIEITEKPLNPISNIAVTGLYYYDSFAVEMAKQLKPSKRGELEISEINQCYLHQSNLNLELLGRGAAWLDTGTHESLLQAGQFIQTIEARQGFKIACLEEIAYCNGWISKNELERLALNYTNDYQDYLLKLIQEPFSEVNICKDYSS
ncbi:MAG: glucose-1-phosphate thymidylyltransferase [Chlamydiae bacterium CG10_big_fil_rev_8_21_14_0_10_35_9]|nr:MAG: glucose-1-phosphate thymidylyltransferase [Chlamydiae bacterium CG10_big_fil_rev_8_21_14_0_10_35_9]